MADGHFLLFSVKTFLRFCSFKGINSIALHGHNYAYSSLLYYLEMDYKKLYF